jgi:predicted nucleic acid-binding protein
MPTSRPTEKVVLETTAWVAILDDEEGRAEHVERLLLKASAGEAQIYTSAITTTEITKGPKADDPALTDEQATTFARFLEHEYVTQVSVDPIVAEKAKELRRAHHGLRTPDAIHVATAVVIGAGVLYTYDKRQLRLDGDELLDGLRILEPPVEHQTDLGFADEGDQTSLDDA